MKVFLTVMFTALLAAGAFAPSQAAVVYVPRAGLPGDAGAASIGKRAMAPFGAVRFCRENAAHCSVRASRIKAVDGRVVLTPDLMSKIRRTNASVNAAMVATNDTGGKNADRWKVGGSTGDCEDFALTKRRALIRQGFPTSATLLATARTARGVMHAVLVVRTDRGDFVLDNLSGDVKPWRAVSYRWKTIQSPENPTIWRTL